MSWNFCFCHCLSFVFVLPRHCCCCGTGIVVVVAALFVFLVATVSALLFFHTTNKRVTVAILQPLQVVVQLPLIPTITTIPPMLVPCPYLLHQLIHPTENWEELLWKHIHPSQELFHLAHNLITGVPIIIPTNAAMNAAKQSCFEWTYTQQQNYGKALEWYQDPTKMPTLPDQRHLAYSPCFIFLCNTSADSH